MGRSQEAAQEEEQEATRPGPSDAYKNDVERTKAMLAEREAAKKADENEGAAPVVPLADEDTASADEDSAPANEDAARDARLAEAAKEARARVAEDLEAKKLRDDVIAFYKEVPKEALVNREGERLTAEEKADFVLGPLLGNKDSNGEYMLTVLEARKMIETSLKNKYPGKTLGKKKGFFTKMFGGN